MASRSPAGWQRSATFRFYEELNDFLPPARRKRSFEQTFQGTPAVKDVIEGIGVPHTEVDLILVDGVSVGFAHRLRGGERVAVYPVFERLDIGPLNRLRPEPLREPRFILDVHLGKLARYLRLLGFDAAYSSQAADETLAARSAAEHRIVLTRDLGLLKRTEVTHGYWLRNTDPRRQLAEVVDALDLRGRLAPFSRCMLCNAVLETVPEPRVRAELPEGIRGRYERIARCPKCRRLYWPGSHYDRMARLLPCECRIALGADGPGSRSAKASSARNPRSD